MKTKWIRIGTLFIVLLLLLIMRGADLALVQQEEWRTFEDVESRYSLQHPRSWQVETVFTNPQYAPRYVIRKRTQFSENSDGAKHLTVDVWEKQPDTSVATWFQTVENITPLPEANALINGRDAFFIAPPAESCAPAPLALYIPFEERVFRIHYTGPSEASDIEELYRILRSFTLLSKTMSIQTRSTLPQWTFTPELSCDPENPNTCPSGCNGKCTYAAISEGCCGYPRISGLRWQCSKQCHGSQVGGFNGNCVWWAAYTRWDAGFFASGPAKDWADRIRQTGQLPVDRTPKVGDIVVHPYKAYNHVGYVVWVSSDRKSYKMSDMGWCGDCGPTPEEAKSMTVDSDDEFIHCAGDPAIPATDWHFTNCPFGWTPSKGFSASKLNGSTWILDPASDPYLLSPIIAVSAGWHDGIKIHMANHAQDTSGKIYFTTSSSPNFDETKAVNFTTNNDGNYREYAVKMSANPHWRGRITRIRIDPVGAGNDGYDDVGISRVRFANLDTTPPTLSFNTPTENRWYNTNETLSWTILDPESGINRYTWWWDDQAPHSVNVADLPPEVNASQGLNTAGQGQHDLYVEAWNGVNLSTQQRTDGWFGYDTIPPGAPAIREVACDNVHNVRNNQWQNTCLDPSFTWRAMDRNGEDGSGISQYTYAWGTSASASTWPAWGTETSYDPGPIVADDGVAQYFLHVKSRDVAGNPSATNTFGFWFDSTAPTITRFAINEGAEVTNKTNVRLDIRTNDTGSGVAALCVSAEHGNCSNWRRYDERAPIYWQLPAMDHVTHTLYLTLHDQAGNQSDIVSDTIYMDLTPPMPHSPNYRICQYSMEIGGTRGITSPNYSLVSTVGQAWSTGADVSTSTHYSEQAGFLTNITGCLPISHVVSPVPPLYQQPVLPAEFQVRINDDGDGTNFYTNEADVEIKAHAPNVVDMLISNDDNPSGGTWQPYQITTTWPLSPSTSLASTPTSISQEMTTHAVYLWFRDSWGNDYGPYFDIVFYDTVAPSGEVEVQDRHISTVTLSLLAWDEGSGVTAMRLSDQAGWDGAIWQAYQKTQVWARSTTSQRLYVQFRDRAGNVSPVYSVQLSRQIYLPVVLRQQ